MKILITGSAGFVGKNLFYKLKDNYEVFGISRRQSDTTTHSVDLTSDKIISVLNKINPDIVVHCAALSNVDYCEEHKKEAELQNVKSTSHLASWTKKNNKKLIFISTDYVYGGEESDYDEESNTSPVNLYGKTKLDAENMVRRLDNFAILRTSTVFGYDKGSKNFLMQLLFTTSPRKIPIDQISNPTNVDILIEYIKKIIEKNVKGIFVATGPESMSRLEFANLIAEIFKLDKKLLIAAKTNELGQIARRPLNNGTNSQKIRAILSLKVPGVRESLINIRESLKNE